MKPYVPSILLGMMGLFFMALPFLAVALVVAGFFSAAIFYAIIIHRIRKLKSGVRRNPDGSIDTEFTPMNSMDSNVFAQQPNYQDVRVYVKRHYF